MIGAHHEGSLAWYVTELIDALGDGEPEALRRMRHLVGSRRAAVALSGDRVLVWFESSGRLRVVAPEPGRSSVEAAGEGSTSHEVVLAILDGDLEATDAILDGDVEVRGSTASVAAMLAAIDILLDASGRLPALRRLAAAYRDQHAHLMASPIGRAVRSTRWPPALVDPGEDELLASLGLDSH